MSTRAAEADPSTPAPRWPWVALALAAAWAVAVRVPLVLNAANHLDSDLAVDGLTLLDATRGHWRWHYPGTPFMGAAPVLLSLPQALVWGANPVTLVSGGVVAYLGLMAATFLLARRAFGPRVAVWSLVPLAFASNGAVWLSGRITGGHLPAAAWHAGAFAIFAAGLERGGRAVALGLGFWCGVGLYLDSMFAVTLAGLVPAAVCVWVVAGVPRRGVLAGALFLLGFAGGVWPRAVGGRVDPHDAYRGQFAPVFAPDLLAGHARILAAECLPRLLAGHRLPGLEADPDPASLAGPAGYRRREPFDPGAGLAVGLTAACSVLVLAGLGRALRRGPGRAVVVGLLLSSTATVAGFVVNRNIFHSDNYRYLVVLLVPWALGFGLAAEALRRSGRAGAAGAAALAAVLAVVMTADLFRWYARFGWVDGRGRAVVRPVNDPAAEWLAAHPEVTWIDGGYWDVYRLAFRTGGRVLGAPFPVYPNRYPEWRPGPGARRVTLTRPTPEGTAYRDAVLRAGGRVEGRSRGLTILSGP